MDNNAHPIGPPESRLVWLRQEGTIVTAGLEDLPVITEVVLSPGRQEHLPRGDAQKALEMLDERCSALLLQSRKNVTACERNAAR